MAEHKTCSKCKAEMPIKRADNYCPECRAEYTRTHRDDELARKESKGFAAGVRQMKELLAEEFERLGGGHFSGDEVAALIRQAPGPLVEQGS